jgi:adenine phosphoribosyltransferase
MDSQAKLKSAIRTIPDFPKAGIMFRDVTTLFSDAAAFKLAIESLAANYKEQNIAQVAGIEARGFIVGAALATALGAGFTAIRKQGKLPHNVLRQDYDLEYGTDTLELHTDAFTPNTRVLLVDDLLATGGTALAAVGLLRQLQADVVGAAFIIDLPDLGGGNKLQQAGVPPFALVAYEGH